MCTVPLKTFLLFLLIHNALGQKKSWHYECSKGFCQKTTKKVTEVTNGSTLDSCRLICNKFAGLWPKPTGQMQIQKDLVNVNANSIDIFGASQNPALNNLLIAASHLFRQQVSFKAPHATGRTLFITINIKDHHIDDLDLFTNEQYELHTNILSDGRINVNISAETFFGARHGLVTLDQLIVGEYDILQMPSNVFIRDAPVYPYRGILLDTSRNYISVAAIKRTLLAMGASKLNRFHWHITDSHSFPLVIPARPELSEFGAYGPSQVYSQQDIEDVVEFALEMGVKVVPEFDAPAHVGEGWQNTSFVVCFNKQPWNQFCVEPPCGQFDPTQDELYDYLEDIYYEMIEAFKPDIFHMGGDEVDFRCWSSNVGITNWMKKNKMWTSNSDNALNFIKLWMLFQERAVQRIDKVTNSKRPLITLWTSKLTNSDNINQHLPNDSYIIQVWTKKDDPQIEKLLKAGYYLIMSNYDALYLDCGFSGWVSDGNNWCSPFIGWQKVYDNDLRTISGQFHDQILGSEVALWTEQVDNNNVDSRLWPRSAALAERLWSNPNETWHYAEQRFLVHRNRLVSLGLNADANQPQWCMQHEGNCPLNKFD